MAACSCANRLNRGMLVFNAFKTLFVNVNVDVDESQSLEIEEIMQEGCSTILVFQILLQATGAVSANIILKLKDRASHLFWGEVTCWVSCFSGTTPSPSTKSTGLGHENQDSNLS